MDIIRISAVKYANTYPFIWGLKESGFDKKVILETDHPSDCASKLEGKTVDIGLIPVAMIPRISYPHIISNYCIGAGKKVRTVMLLSNEPLNNITAINLDYRSMSSVNLTKVLAKFMWQKEFRWINTTDGFDFSRPPHGEAVVLIGDQCFELESRFRFKTDLAEEWNKQTGLPFVFACWVANRELDIGFVSDFNLALGHGVNNIDKVVEYFSDTSVIKGEDLRDYLNHNIEFILDQEKRKGMDLFLSLLQKL
jgi:chorismate dehydratase